ncbi:hypothetical protein F5B19DRAFT_471055 [Rostrohypoxylon terebratum]|nr:hypothetical protein F5B19DRAFT_471055 [Rostrohypoxylon terebratum]
MSIDVNLSCHVHRHYLTTFHLHLHYHLHLHLPTSYSYYLRPLNSSPVTSSIIATTHLSKISAAQKLQSIQHSRAKQAPSKHQSTTIMSFLTEAAARRLALTSRVIAVPVPRHFTTSIAAQKTVTEAAKDTLQSVNRKVSDKIVDGINAGETIVSKVKGEADAGKAKESAEEIRGKLKAKAEEAKGAAKGAAKEAEGEVKGSL